MSKTNNMDKKYIVKRIIRNYSGPHTDSLTTILLYDEKGIKIAWHNGPNKELKCEIGNIFIGIIINDKKVVNYKQSNPIKVNVQTSLF